ncbi:MAG: pantothenate kinase [Clostridia bacterium]|nr:pantothenate kinase [Clostridia bacterium]
MVETLEQAAARINSSKTVIGIDVGGSTTKIVGFAPDGTLITPMFIKATDPVTAVYGAFGRFTLENKLSLGDIDRIMMTGAGSAFITEPIYGLTCRSVSEFASVGTGGLYLSGLDEAIVVSMGTGTALIHAKNSPDGPVTEYLGGTGIGGGTITGLARKMLGIDTVVHLDQICEGGDLSRVDLRIRDISRPEIFPEVNLDLTASNFGNLSDLASRHDIALGIFNMVAETVAMMSIFAARSFKLKDIVLTGNLTAIKPMCKVFETLAPTFGVNFIIPELSRYGTVIGAALQTLKKED